MKRILTATAIATILSITLTGCAGWDTIATVDGGSGWFAGDYAPYYWSDWNTPPPPPPVIGNGPGSLRPGFIGNNRPAPPPTTGNRPPTVPGNRPGYDPTLPGNNTRPAPPPTTGNRPSTNPGTPAQGGFRGQK